MYVIKWFLTGRQDHSMGKVQSFQQRVLRKVGIDKQKNKVIRPFPYTMYKIYLKWIKA